MSGFAIKYNFIAFQENELQTLFWINDKVSLQKGFAPAFQIWLANVRVELFMFALNFKTERRGGDRARN